jgi:predicted branched-subunit amino acid permease
MMSFRKGFIDAMPILLGYFAVGFTVAVAAIANGHPVWSPILLSLTHVSGTSQGAIVNNIVFKSASIPGLGELVLLCMALNLRYILLSLAVAQKLEPSTSTPKRLLLACGITDEIVAVAISQPVTLTFKYVLGLFVSSYIGWNLGTVVGAFGTTLLPTSLLAPLSIALYAMFIAIVTPMAKKSRPILLAVTLAAVINITLHTFPSRLHLKDSVAILLSGITAAAICSFIYPHKDEKKEADK